MNNVKVLDEIDSYLLLAEHEDVFLFDKDLNKEVWRSSCYGNAACGVIGLDDEWAAVGGEYLIIWFENKLHHIKDSDLKWIYDLRQVGSDEIELLTDPWSKNAAVWKFNVRTLKKFKKQDFKDYFHQPWQEQVTW